MDTFNKYECPYLCFTAEEDNSAIQLNSINSAGTIISLANKPTLYTSSDGEDFSSWDGSKIDLNKGDKVYIYGNNSSSWAIISGSNLFNIHFSMSGTVKGSGNIQSLINSGCPDTIPFDYCYAMMFSGCKSLTSTPKLPATTLTDYCYFCMFRGCRSLTNAPELPATTLTDYCYFSLFDCCTSLTEAPELPATTLTDYCYFWMFFGCTSLINAPELPATTLADNCYTSMFIGCTSLTNAPSILPATTLVNGCYSNMFYSCSKLNYIKAMFTTEPSTAYTHNWVYKVASTGTFVKNADATWDVTGVNGIPTNWTVETATV